MGRRLSVLGILAIVATVLVNGAGLAAYAFYYDLYGNLSQESIDTDAFEDRPSRVEGAVNVLIIGSDVRTGDNANYGDAEGERPDTLIIAHVSPENQSATLVNLPRDSVVDLQACEASEDRPGMPPSRDMIGVALSLGGPACLWENVEQLTGIHIDHYVHMDFTGFKGMVDALGGVEMCIPEPIDDERAHLQLDAGTQTLDGETALGFVRARYSIGDGSDRGRIERQQEFMAAMARKATSSEILASPGNLYNFLGAVTDSITTDDSLTLDTMADLAIAMREVDLGDIEFVTVPNGDDPADPNRIVWVEPEASQLFEAVAQDVPLTSEEDEEPEEGTEGEDEAPSSVAPEEVTVEVLNGTDIDGLAGEVAAGLTDMGFVIAGTGNPVDAVPPATTVYYGPGQQEHAEALAAELANATVEENPNLAGTLQLVLASDWNGFGGGGSAGAPDSVDATTAAEEERDAC